MEASSWFLLTLLAILSIVLLHRLTKKHKNKKLPPGPKGVPILGHLHMLGKNPHQDLHKLAKQHGPIMYMQFGFVPNIIVSSPKAAELFLKTYDLVFASRPPHEAAKYLSWDQRNLSFGSYGPYWRNMRKLCTLQLLSNMKINSFQPMRKEELGIFIENLKGAARESVAVDLSAKIASLTADMSCRMVFGKKYDDNNMGGFNSAIQEGMRLGAAFNLGDYFPFLGVLDLQGLTSKMKKIAQVFDDFFDKVIDEHVRELGNNHGKSAGDIVDTMMSIMQSGESEFQFDRRHVKAILLDMVAASMDTASSTVEWVLSELFKNPKVMKKLQKELEQTVGLNRLVDESDLDQLQYLDIVVKETFRLHPAAPLLLPHYAMEDCIVDNFDIPKQSRVIINTYAIGRDPNVWADPEKFSPERFIGSAIDVRGQNFELLPFGSGRRGCPGLQLGLLQVRLIVAQLVHCFDWRLANGMLPEDLDMDEEFGIVVSRANHLIAIPTFRLQD